MPFPATPIRCPLASLKVTGRNTFGRLPAQCPAGGYRDAPTDPKTPISPVLWCIYRGYGRRRPLWLWAEKKKPTGWVRTRHPYCPSGNRFDKTVTFQDVTTVTPQRDRCCGCGWRTARLQQRTRGQIWPRLAGWSPIFLDEDDMASDSAMAVPSQQSVKAFASNPANHVFRAGRRRRPYLGHEGAQVISNGRDHWELARQISASAWGASRRFPTTTSASSFHARKCRSIRRRRLQTRTFLSLGAVPWSRIVIEDAAGQINFLCTDTTGVPDAAHSSRLRTSALSSMWYRRLGAGPVPINATWSYTRRRRRWSDPRRGT